MNLMKKIILLGVMVVTFIILFSMMSSKEVVAPQPTPVTLPTQFTMTVPETKFNVTISSYTGNTVEYGDFEGNQQAGYGTVTMMPQYLVAMDKGYVGTFAVNYGGSGEMVYLGYFEQSETSYKLTSSVLLGDRVDVSSLVTDDADTVTVSYYEHGPDQSLAEKPEVLVIKTFNIKNAKLIEVKN